MPPLLAEYLPETLQIILKPAATDWKAVWLGAGATLLGAAIGAWVGGKKGYESALKAGQRLNKQSKVEECTLLALKIQSLLMEEDIQTDPVARPVNAFGMQDNLFDEEALKQFNEAADRLHALVDLYNFASLPIAQDLMKTAFHLSRLTKQLLRYSRMSQEFSDAGELLQLRRSLLRQMRSLVRTLLATLKAEL